MIDERHSDRPTWLTLATRKAVVRRALLYAVIVGPILITINHYDALFSGALFSGAIDATRAVKMAMTVVVPYLVSTFSSVSALRSATSTNRP
jgi:hypothetical protein